MGKEEQIKEGKGGERRKSRRRERKEVEQEGKERK